jgi:hypothetical protein
MMKDATTQAMRSMVTENAVSMVPDGTIPEVLRADARLTRIARLTHPVRRLMGTRTAYRSVRVRDG